MRVALRLVLDCPPDAAWEALQSPDVFREVFHPLANVEPIDPPVFPQAWPDGPTLLRLTSFSGLVPLGERILCVSGRLSFELVQKAAVAGAPILVGVGAPSSLAISLADDRGMTLCGFARRGSVNVYTRPERVRD